MRKKSDKKADGKAGERFANEQIAKALCGESVFGTSTDDAAKVDIRFSFRNAFDPSRNIVVNCQVKHGDSYCRGEKNGILRLAIDGETLRILRASGTFSFLVWVPQKNSQLYWWSQDPRTDRIAPVKIPKTQEVTPCFRYDISRLVEYASFSGRQARQTVAQLETAEVLSRAKQAYRDLKSANRSNPLAGEILVSRMAWRHVTRRSKTAKKRNASLRVLPHVKRFITQIPDRFAMVPIRKEIRGKFTTEHRYLLFWYRSALLIDGRVHSLLLRIEESCCYPTNWRQYPLSAHEVKHEVKLASWWAKPDK